MLLTGTISFLSLLSVVLSGRLLSQGASPRQGRCRQDNGHASTAVKSLYSLTDLYQGEEFFNDWDFYTGRDPSHGNVQYLDRANATSNMLAYVQSDGVAVITVDDYTALPVGGNRNSVRISTKKSYNGGLFIADFVAMPYGCAVWPAWWSLSSGAEWPVGGELDIVEGINNQGHNQDNLHTAPNCTIPLSGFTGSPSSGQCTSSDTDDSGCSIIDQDTRSYGAGFNNAGGGVFAQLWDSSGIKVWFFSRQEIPQDITSQAPDPSTWPTPSAFFASSSSCDMSQLFYDQVFTINTTICGDWAGGAYPKSGCPGTCEEAVADPSNFSNAKFLVNYIAVYN